MNGTIRSDHGMTRTQLYRKWQAIKEIHGWKKGMVDPDWLTSFVKFRDYVGEPPTTKHRLRRVDNKLPFMPGNVHWVEEVTERELRQRETEQARPPSITKRAWWESYI